jgi:hypothetical protein
MSRAPDPADAQAVFALVDRLRAQYETIPVSRRDGRSARILEQCLFHATLLLGGLEDLQRVGTVIPFKRGDHASAS